MGRLRFHDLMKMSFLTFLYTRVPWPWVLIKTSIFVRFLASESEGKVWAMVVANIHEEWVDPNAIKAGLMWHWNLEIFSVEVIGVMMFFYIQFQILLGPGLRHQEIQQKRSRWWNDRSHFLALRELLLYDSSCEKKKRNLENRTWELQFFNVLELFFHAAFGNLGLFVSASRGKALMNSKSCEVVWLL